MTWHPDLPIRSAPRGSAEQALALLRGRASAYRPRDIHDYLTELWRLAPQAGLDPAILFAQALHETGGFTSPAWRDRLNPAGIGITDGGDHGYRWQSGAAAARAHVVHMDVYVNGVNASPLSGDVLAPYYALDPRRQVVVDRGWAGTVKTIRDLTGKWATDPRYHEKIIRWAQEVFREEATMPTLNMQRGLIPLPPMEDAIVDVSRRCQGDGRGYDWLGARTIRGVVLHRSQGTWESNQAHFHSFCPGALTDLQVHHQTGQMMRFVRLAAPPEAVNAPSGWANGRVNGAYGDGKKFLDWWGPRSGIGVNVVNRDLESCEITGYFAQPGSSVTRDDPVSDACWETLARWIASRAHDYGITYETFPLIPSEGNRSFVIWHQEFTLPAFSLTSTAKICPGRVVIEGTDALLARARAIMMEAQTGAGAPVSDPPPASPPEHAGLYPPGLDRDLAERWFGRVQAYGRTYAFNPDGPVSRAWLAHGRRTGEWPALIAVERYEDGPERVRTYYRFAGGLVLWQAQPGAPVQELVDGDPTR